MELREKRDGNDGGMERSRGGLTSKIHALVDADGRPVTLSLTAGQIADCQEAEALIETLSEGDILLADKGYDANAIRVKAAEKKPGPIYRQKPTARAYLPFPRGFIASVTSSNVSSIRSSSFEE